jgi:hypothetical protein
MVIDADAAGGGAIDERLLQLPEVGGGRGGGLEVPAQSVAHRARSSSPVVASLLCCSYRKSIEQDKWLFENGKA